MKGITVSKGVAVGKAYLLDRSKFCILKQKLKQNEVENEVERFRGAIENTKLQMKDILQLKFYLIVCTTCIICLRRI